MGTRIATLILMSFPQKRAISEIQLLHQEIEAHGDWLTQERLERKAELDHLKIQIETLKRTLLHFHPDGLKRFALELERVKVEFNPESS